MQKLVFTNGEGISIDLTSGNFGITNWAGLSNAPLNIQTQQVPFEDGGVFLDALIEQREIELTVAIKDDNDLELRYQKKRELISALNPKLGEGVLIYTNDFLSKQIHAVPQIPLFENKNSNDPGTLKASVVFSCPSPYWEDTEETEVILNNGVIANIENYGDIDIGVKVTIKGLLKNPLIENQNEEKKILINGEYNTDVEINTNVGKKQVVTKDNIMTWQDGGDFNVFVTDGYRKIYAGSQVCYQKGDGEIISINNVFNQIITAGVYYKGTFYLGARNGYYYKSTDGLNWTEGQNFPFIREYNYMTVINDKVFICEALKIFVSDDLENWTIVYTSDSEYCRFYKIIFANNKYVAVGGYHLNEQENIIISSEDLQTWNTSVLTHSYDLYGDQELLTVAYGNGFYYALAKHGLIYKSSDGDAWSIVGNVTDLGSFKDVVFDVSQNCFIVSSHSGLYKIENFEEEYYEFLIGCDHASIFVCNEGNYMVCEKGQIIYSKNFINFITIRQLGFLPQCYFKGYFYTIHASKVYKSIDGLKDWQEIPSITGIFLANSNDMIVIKYGNYVYSSKDGINFTHSYVGTLSSNAEINYSNGRFLISSTHDLFVSSNGINWEALSVGSYYVHSACYNNGTYVVCANNANVSEYYLLKSTDGITWDVVETSNREIKKIIYENQTYVKIYYQYIAHSTDLINWQEITCADVSDVIYNGLYYIFGYRYGVRILSKTFELIADYKKIVFVIFSKVVFGINKIFASGSNPYSPNVSTALAVTKLTDNKNIIDKLSSDSNMTLGLKIGNNHIIYKNENDMNTLCYLSYRQKYIGV